MAASGKWEVGPKILVGGLSHKQVGGGIGGRWIPKLVEGGRSIPKTYVTEVEAPATPSKVFTGLQPRHA